MVPLTPKQEVWRGCWGVWAGSVPESQQHMDGVRSPGAPQSACGRESMRGHFLRTRAFLRLLRGSQSEPEALSKTPLERTDCSNIEDTICRTSLSSQGRWRRRGRSWVVGGPLPGSCQRPPLHAPFYLTPRFSASPAPSTFSEACFFWTKHMFPLLRHTPLHSADIPGQPRWAGPWGSASQHSLNSLR